MTGIVPISPPLVEVSNEVHDELNGGIMGTEVRFHFLDRLLKPIYFSKQRAYLLPKRMELAIHFITVDSLALEDTTQYLIHMDDLRNFLSGVWVDAVVPA
jgi:hypothetical protein